MTPKILGYQSLIELYDCNPNKIKRFKTVRRAVLQAAREAGATIVTDLFHEFNPYGVSGVVVIAESHIAIHTWPEHGCVSIDFFSCSPELSTQVVETVLSKAFGARGIERTERTVRIARQSSRQGGEGKKRTAA